MLSWVITHHLLYGNFLLFPCSFLEGRRGKEDRFPCPRTFQQKVSLLEDVRIVLSLMPSHQPSWPLAPSPFPLHRFITRL